MRISKVPIAPSAFMKVIYGMRLNTYLEMRNLAMVVKTELLLKVAKLSCKFRRDLVWVAALKGFSAIGQRTIKRFTDSRTSMNFTTTTLRGSFDIPLNKI